MTETKSHIAAPDAIVIIIIIVAKMPCGLFPPKAPDVGAVFTFEEEVGDDATGADVPAGAGGDATGELAGAELPRLDGINTLSMAFTTPL